MAIEHLTFHQTSFDTVHVPHPEKPFAATFFGVSPYPYVDGSSRVTEFDEVGICLTQVAPTACGFVLDSPSG